MIFNSQGDATLRQYINGQTITPGEEEIILPGGSYLLGDVIIAAVEEVKPYAAELQYIQSSGTQYIDTGFKPNQNTRIVCDFQNMDTSALVWLFGVQPSWAVSMFDIAIYANGTVHTGYGANSATINCNVGTARQIVDKNKNVTTVGGVTNTLGAQTFQAEITAVLFAYRHKDGIGNNAKARIYSCQIYDNGTLVRDFIPVLDNNGVACLYDKVEGKLYYNQGSGAFSYT